LDSTYHSRKVRRGEEARLDERRKTCLNLAMNDLEPTAEQTLPPSGRLLGVDYGAVRIGLAICDARRKIASPLAMYQPRTPRLDAEYFQRLVQAEEIVGLVIGLPLHLSGDESSKSLEVRRFAEWLARVTDRPFVLFDERYSTVAASELIGNELTKKQRRARLDKVAAQVILTAYLESHPDSDWQSAIDQRS
jgi:putative Holliday junction resolvase